jgi:hypothetical protein
MSDQQTSGAVRPTSHEVSWPAACSGLPHGWAVYVRDFCKSCTNLRCRHEIRKTRH